MNSTPDIHFSNGSHVFTPTEERVDEKPHLVWRLRRFRKPNPFRHFSSQEARSASQRKVLTDMRTGVPVSNRQLADWREAISAEIGDEEFSQSESLPRSHRICQIISEIISQAFSWIRGFFCTWFGCTRSQGQVHVQDLEVKTFEAIVSESDEESSFEEEEFF